jgi:ABC-type multidrug transport system ATPase subunit
VTPDFDRVELSGLTRNFGRRRAVQNVSLAVNRGEILGLLGPNGAGKSTLIGMLATLVAPTAGTIRYGAVDAKSAGADLRRSIGLLAHELHLYNELTAQQNLEFFARLYGIEPSTVVARALDRAGLSARAGDAVSGFSRGMRQRLALERTLLHQPRLVLLDEPFTGLDDQAVGTVSARLRGLAEEGAIVILATHDLDLADGLITRMAVVRSGKLQVAEQGTSGLRARYRELTAGEHVH